LRRDSGKNQNKRARPDVGHAQEAEDIEMAYIGHSVYSYTPSFWERLLAFLRPASINRDAVLIELHRLQDDVRDTALQVIAEVAEARERWTRVRQSLAREARGEILDDMRSLENMMMRAQYILRSQALHPRFEALSDERLEGSIHQLAETVNLLDGMRTTATQSALKARRSLLQAEETRPAPVVPRRPVIIRAKSDKVAP